MIKLHKYSEEDEKRLLNLIKHTSAFHKVVDDVRKEINDNENIRLIIEKLPEKSNDIVDNIILANYEDLKKVKGELETCRYSFIEKATVINESGEEEEKTELKPVWKKYVKQYSAFTSEIKYKGLPSKKINIELLKAQKNKVCPYCNENYITNRDQRAGHQLDHFYSKQIYPIFALSIYNLIPSCSACNLMKSENDLELSPFDDLFDFENISITYIPKSMDYLYDEDEFDICFMYDGENDKEIFKSNRKYLRLDYAYENHKDYLIELMRKGQIYNREAISNLLGSFPEMFSSEFDVLQIVYANYLDYSELNQRPLSKMTRDYLKEIGILT